MFLCSYSGSFQSNVTTPAPHEFLARVSGEYIICGAVMVCVMLVLFGYVIYKIRGARLALDYEAVGSALGGPVVPVLVVYPAESELSQRAVGALAEFLQQHGGCSVAVDMWQQGSVAKLGPMRWLLEQVQAAHRVLIVAAQPSPEMLTIPGASIPAAAQDLYALALNLVAGQAKNSTDLAKFWVVRFRESAALTSELKACRSFSLMKDLDKLCRCLHEQDVNMKIADLLLRRNHCSRDATEKLRAAVQALSEKQGSATKNLNIV
ncbi:interleukin-17 receptor B-like [Eucyclogobius newberryi]|uniref:interleukin-17 receptor B-like n=1 Tax=Eucyclogobius newberryi TaxID=166745 RepID=UPI003B5987DB